MKFKYHRVEFSSLLVFLDTITFHITNTQLNNSSYYSILLWTNLHWFEFHVELNKENIFMYMYIDNEYLF